MISELVAQEVKEYFQHQYPKEACGFILKDGNFVPCENIANDVYNHFKVKTSDFLMHENNLLAVVHSHPDGQDAPSKADMTSQIASGIPFGLCVVRNNWVGNLWFWGDGIPKVDLIGRSFRHGPTGSDGKGDCFALIRDYMAQECGIKLNEYPRDSQWWNNGANMYEEYFEQEGFREIDGTDIKEHDCFLMSVNSNVINHAGIYVGNNLIMHHLANRLSRREPVARWPKMIAKWVRHNDLS